MPLFKSEPFHRIFEWLKKSNKKMVTLRYISQQTLLDGCCHKKVSIVTPPADAAKYDVDQKEPWLLKVLNSGNLSRIIFEELVFKNPTRFETEICGGICSSK